MGQRSWYNEIVDGDGTGKAFPLRCTFPYVKGYPRSRGWGGEFRSDAFYCKKVSFFLLIRHRGALARICPHCRHFPVGEPLRIFCASPILSDILGQELSIPGKSIQSFSLPGEYADGGSVYFAALLCVPICIYVMITGSGSIYV